MTLKDILIHLEPGGDCDRAVRAAASLAIAHDAHVTAVCTYDDPDFSAHPAVPVPVIALEAGRKAIEQSVAACRETFEAAGNHHRIGTEWRAEKGDALRTLIRHSRYADLVVVAKPVKSELAWVEESMAGALCLRSARPVLFVPDSPLPERIGAKIYVGWNGSSEATRAIADAMPLLTSATEVTVVAINAEPGSPAHGPMPCMDICQHLARHGVAARAESLHTEDLSAGELLLTRIVDDGADLLVMGAYGHSRMWELLLGGVTRHVLENATIPVVMSH